jgi:hypothetical protein
MIFDAWVYGELELPQSHFSNWLSHPLGAEGRGPDFITDDSGCVGREPLIILEQIHHLELTPKEFLGVGANHGRVSVRALLSDDALLKSQGLLTGLFASAAAHGGDGRLVVVGRRGTTLGYEVVVCCGAYRARTLSDAERDEFLLSRGCHELVLIDAANHAEAELMQPEPTAPPANKEARDFSQAP